MKGGCRQAEAGLLRWALKAQIFSLALHFRRLWTWVPALSGSVLNFGLERSAGLPGFGFRPCRKLRRFVCLEKTRELNQRRRLTQKEITK